MLVFRKRNTMETLIIQVLIILTFIYAYKNCETELEYSYNKVWYVY